MEPSLTAVSESSHWFSGLQVFTYYQGSPISKACAGSNGLGFLERRAKGPQQRSATFFPGAMRGAAGKPVGPSAQPRSPLPGDCSLQGFTMG